MQRGLESTAAATAALAALALWAPMAPAQSPAALAETYAAEARAETPAFTGFSAARGQAFFTATHGHDWSCASCHTADPRAGGRHAVTKRAIEPLAPVANPARLTRLDQAEKWFRRNCSDVLGRPCSALEKGDVLAYLASLR